MAANNERPVKRGSNNPNAIPCRLCRRMVDKEAMATHLRMYCRVEQAIQRGVVHVEAPRQTPKGQYAPFSRDDAESVLYMAVEQAVDSRPIPVRDSVRIGVALTSLVDILQEVSS